MKHKILIADGLAKEGQTLLKNSPNVELLSFDAIDRKALKEALGSVDILIVRSRTTVDADLLDSAASLKVVIRAGIGLDNINVPAATERGIIVMNAPTGNIVTTAEHAIAMLFATSRHIARADASIRAGKWEKKLFQGSEIRGKTLGIIGLGNIGKVVAQRAQGLEMQVVTYDPYVTPEAAAKYNIQVLSLEDLLARADYVSIHVPLIPATKNLLNAKTLQLMKKGAYVINCARGGIVDEVALVEHLQSGHLAGAALDVFETEPLPADHPLTRLPNVVLTPHLGASTDEAQVQVGVEVADQVTQYIQGGVLKNAVNVPNVTLEQLSVLRPYLTLCERIGAFAAQVGPDRKLSKLRIRYEGVISQYGRELLSLSVLKGFLTPLLSTGVNYVNARNLLKERGIRVEESVSAECDDYASLVELKVEGETSFVCAGTIFGKDEPRIVQIDNFNIDAIPDGTILFTKNQDQPGVIGALGTLISSLGINIARMHLGRDKAKKEAIALINVDSPLTSDGVEALKKVKGMLLVKQISV
ncbi:MAG: phosphoglycerate dehydrogenase [Deltaproteobacteria bacterium]|nr:phosphoglycerate dehydrogenase [Deltaproteobacteria bacterium]MBI3295264.1 phosphoglycerate dehydrogenase [Deltaproteobacteria bacterium]